MNQMHTSLVVVKRTDFDKYLEKIHSICPNTYCGQEKGSVGKNRMHEFFREAIKSATASWELRVLEQVNYQDQYLRKKLKTKSIQLQSEERKSKRK